MGVPSNNTNKEERTSQRRYHNRNTKGIKEGGETLSNEEWIVEIIIGLKGNKWRILTSV